MLYPLYIDPGTGSAIFSIVIGAVAAGYFLIRTLFLKFSVILFKKNKTIDSKYKYVIYAEDNRYWVFFKIILEEFEKRQIEVLYATSSEDDPVFTEGFKYIHGKYIGRGNKAFAFLNFLSADVLLSTTPDLGVLQWKRSKTVKHYCHILHAAGGAVMYKIYALNHYDSILLSSEDDFAEVRYLEKIRKLPEKELIIVGNTYFDMYSEKIKQIQPETEHEFTVLVSPSWGKSALLTSFGEKLLDPLAETGWRIIVRPHPQSITAEKKILDILIEKYKDNKNIIWDFNHENIYSLSKADLMISDFSGIIYDYVFLFNKPVLFNLKTLDIRRYDAYYLKDEPAFINNIRKIGIEIDEKNINNIKEVINNISNNNELEENRKLIKERMWQYKGESGKRITDYLIEKTNKK